jgi:hypothetical protein
MAGVVAGAGAGFHWMNLEKHEEGRQKQKKSGKSY